MGGRSHGRPRHTLGEVAQVSNLLYRRLPVGKPSELSGACGLEIDWKSAIQQVGNLRYESARQF
jgi:hypothetical protein